MGSVAPRRILIVGYGFLGAAIALEAVRRGFETRVLSGSAPRFADGWTAMAGDAADASIVLFAPPDESDQQLRHQKARMREICPDVVSAVRVQRQDSAHWQCVRNPSAGDLIAICNGVTGREMSIVFGHSRNFDVKANVLDISLLRRLIGFRPAAPESIMWDKLSVGVAAPPQT